jgi:hypothetical protein
VQGKGKVNSAEPHRHPLTLPVFRFAFRGFEVKRLVSLSPTVLLLEKVLRSQCQGKVKVGFEVVVGGVCVGVSQVSFVFSGEDWVCVSFW